MARKKTVFRDLNACTKPNDHYGTIFYTMCESAAYKALSIGARHFYTMCRVQARSDKGRRYLKIHEEERGAVYNPEIYFVFPASHLKIFGYDRRNVTKYFKELENAGFIKTVEKNKHTLTKPNVYCFSDKWKDTG